MQDGVQSQEPERKLEVQQTAWDVAHIEESEQSKHSDSGFICSIRPLSIYREFQIKGRGQEEVEGLIISWPKRKFRALESAPRGFWKRLGRGMQGFPKTIYCESIRRKWRIDWRAEIKSQQGRKESIESEDSIRQEWILSGCDIRKQKRRRTRWKRTGRKAFHRHCKFKGISEIDRAEHNDRHQKQTISAVSRTEEGRRN